MVRRRKLDRSRSRNHSGGERCEWLGGKLLAPFFVEDGPEPYRPELAVWMEQPSGLVLGQEVIVPGVVLCGVAVGLGGSAQAVSMDWVTVGAPGNACDTQSDGCFGAVDHAYQIGKYEVTNAQYAELLNAVAATDTHMLYNTEMANGGYGGGITRSYTYSTIAGREKSSR